MPVRQSFLPFHQPWIDDAGIKAVSEVLQSGWITRGPRTEEFERAFGAYVGSRHAIGLSSCTAGLGSIPISSARTPRIASYCPSALRKNRLEL